MSRQIKAVLGVSFVIAAIILLAVPSIYIAVTTGAHLREVSPGEHMAVVLACVCFFVGVIFMCLADWRRK